MTTHRRPRRNTAHHDLHDSTQAQHIDARSITLRDDQGRARIKLACTDEGPAIAVLHEDGTMGALLGMLAGHDRGRGHPFLLLSTGDLTDGGFIHLQLSGGVPVASKRPACVLKHPTDEGLREAIEALA